MSTLGKDFLDPFFFAKARHAYEFDLDTIFPRELFCILTNLVAQRLGKPGVIEDPNVLRIQVRGHAFGMAKSRQSSLQNHPIKTRDNATNLVSMSFQQRCHAKPHTPRA